MKERNYLCSCDDGHDYFSFEFKSNHRAGSKANEEDAKKYYRKHYGRRNFKIVSIALYQ